MVFIGESVIIYNISALWNNDSRMFKKSVWKYITNILIRMYDISKKQWGTLKALPLGISRPVSEWWDQYPDNN